MKESISMNVKELNQINIMQMLIDKKIKQKKAASILGISVRQIRRKLVRFKKDGAKGLIHLNRGRNSNNKISEQEITRAIEIIKQKYTDFKPTLAHEKLVEFHQIKFSLERLRQAMIVEGLYKAKLRRKFQTHQMRERRACEGELVQIDGSPYDWLEGRARNKEGESIGMCSLLVYVDDATSKLLHLELVKSESTWSYFIASKNYLLKNGKPLAFYSDKHGVFRVNTTKNGMASTADSNGITQYGRAMQELGIKIIFASSPQAKGRVEKMNLTLQDRLVKEMRLLGIDSMEKANQYFPKFIEFFNQKFGVEPKDKTNLHRPLLIRDNLEEIFTVQETRVLSKNLTCQYQNKLYQIQSNRPSYAMRGARVTIKENMEGKIIISYKEKKLLYSIYQEQSKSEITDIKQVNQKVDELKKQLDKSGYFNLKMKRKVSPNHPWKNLAIPQKQSKTVFNNY